MLPTRDLVHLNEQVLEFAPNYDHLHGFLDSRPDKVGHWSLFNHDIASREPDVKRALEILKDAQGELFDLRPYMIEQPVKLD